ncbi:MAG: tetratricopeptide repeat protein [Dehalococcoidales bacterium]|nr:tetratricopeptide repeat protein [Dehalococcoidales bacterium]
MSNEELFSKYYIQLHIPVHNAHNYQSYIYLLERFKNFLRDRKPTPDLAKEFIAGYHEKALNTQAKYASIIKGLMKFYGEPVEDLKIKRFYPAPQIVERKSLEEFYDAVRNKKSHKKKIDRDILIFELYDGSGMRRAELLLERLKSTKACTTGMWWLTCIPRHLGGAAFLLERYDEAREHYKEAIRVCTEMRFRPELALSRLGLAELLLAHYPDEKAEALEHLDFAIKEFREMKMQPSLERALRKKDILKA